MTDVTARDIPRIKEILSKSASTVFFGGAGMSTDSGIPDFRGTKGLYTAPIEDDNPPEYLLSRRCLAYEPEKFFRYYRGHMIYPEAKPNAAHRALAELEQRGLLQAVVTQNIDGLHQLAGSRNVMELHGTTKRNYCVRCGKNATEGEILSSSGIPRCSCGGLIRPDVVLYGEGLDGDVFGRAEDAILGAEVLIVGGSSLTVQPAASLVGEFSGKTLILINYSETPYDARADFLLRDSVAEVLPALL